MDKDNIRSADKNYSTALLFIMDESNEIRLLQINKAIERNYLKDNMLFDTVLFETKYIYDVSFRTDELRNRFLNIKNENDFQNILQEILSSDGGLDVNNPESNLSTLAFSQMALRLVTPVTRCGYLLSDDTYYGAGVTLFDCGLLDINRNLPKKYDDIEYEIRRENQMEKKVFYDILLNTNDLFGDNFVSTSDSIPHPSYFIYDENNDDSNIKSIAKTEHMLTLNNLISTYTYLKLLKINTTGQFYRTDFIESESDKGLIGPELNSYLENTMVEFDILFSQSCLSKLIVEFDEDYSTSNILNIKELLYDKNNIMKKIHILDNMKTIIDKLKEMYLELIQLIDRLLVEKNPLDEKFLEVENIYFHIDEAQSNVAIYFAKNKRLPARSFVYKFTTDKIKTVEKYLEYFVDKELDRLE